MHQVDLDGTRPPASSAAPRRSRGGRLGLVVGIVALVGVAGAGLATMFGGDNGASSPEAAVRSLADAAAAEDILGAAKLVPPSEIGSAPELYDLVIKVLQKHDQLGPAGKPLAGIDIRVDDLELSTEQYSDRVAKVELISGTFRSTVSAADLDPEMRRSLEESGDPVEDSDGSVTVAELRELLDESAGSAEEAGVPGMAGRPSGIYLMTIRQDGRWYVSFQYTMLEYAREVMGGELPAFGPEATGTGTSSPEALLQVAIDQLNGLDAATIADAIERQGDLPGAVAGSGSGTGYVNPAENQAFIDYLPMFQALAKQLSGQSGQSGSAATKDIADQVRDLDIEVRASAEPEVRRLADGRSMVVVRTAEITASVRGVIEGERIDQSLTLQVRDGQCVQWQVRGEIGGDRNGAGDEECGDVFSGTDFSGFFFVAVRSGGSWYLSPVETIVQYARFALEAELAR